MKTLVLALFVATSTGCVVTQAPVGRAESAAARRQLTSRPIADIPAGYALCNRNVDFMTCNAARLADYSVLLRTNRGDIHLELWPQYAPNHVRNFLDLCTTGFYDDTVFCATYPDIGIVGGDPTGSEYRPLRQGTHRAGGPRRLSPELNALVRDEAGVLYMDHDNDPDSASSIFTITNVPRPGHARFYTAFGKVISGMNVVDAIAHTEHKTTYNRPLDPQVILAALVLVEADHDPNAGPGGFHVYEAPAKSPPRSSAPLSFTVHATGDLVGRLRDANAFADIEEAFEPKEMLLGENELVLSGPVEVRIGDVALPPRVIPDAAAYEASPAAIDVQATFLAHTGLRVEPFRWTVTRPWLVSTQSGARPEAIRAVIAEKCTAGWEAACARSLCEPNALAEQLSAALAARDSTEQVTARIEYLRSRSNELRTAASEQKTRASDLDRQIADLEARDTVAVGLKDTTSALSGISNDPLAGLHAAGAQIRLDQARAQNEQNRAALARAAGDARQLAAKYESLAARADSMITPLLERMYSTSGG